MGTSEYSAAILNSTLSKTTRGLSRLIISIDLSCSSSFNFRGIQKLQKAVEMRDPFLRRKLEEHKATFNPDNLRDFTDSLIKSSQEPEFLKHCEGDGVIDDVTGIYHVCDDRLEMILFDIFLGKGPVKV